jgi:hypothetical protein
VVLDLIKGTLPSNKDAEIPMTTKRLSLEKILVPIAEFLTSMRPKEALLPEPLTVAH